MIISPNESGRDSTRQKYKFNQPDEAMQRKIAKELPAYSQSNFQRVETERKSQTGRYSPLPSIERP
jgi:septation ring formation regulator EzrA